MTFHFSILEAISSLVFELYLQTGGICSERFAIFALMSFQIFWEISRLRITGREISFSKEVSIVFDLRLLTNSWLRTAIFQGRVTIFLRLNFETSSCLKFSIFCSGIGIITSICFHRGVEMLLLDVFIGFIKLLRTVCQVVFCGPFSIEKSLSR